MSCSTGRRPQFTPQYSLGRRDRFRFSRVEGTATRYETVRAVADQIRMRMIVAGKRVEMPSYLPEILDLAYATGRRLGAICALRASDYLPKYTDETTGKPLPYGAIRWRGETDKMGKEWITPINHIAKAALDRAIKRAQSLGDGPLFPDPRDPSTSIRRHRPDNWLRQAEKLAGLEPQQGSLWHAYRRGWATARKGMSPEDVAHAGGWKSVQTMQQCYVHADMTTMLEVVTAPVELRETGTGDR